MSNKLPITNINELSKNFKDLNSVSVKIENELKRKNDILKKGIEDSDKYKSQLNKLSKKIQ